MTDAPETVWLDWRPGLAVTQGPLASPPFTQYIRADVAKPKVKPLEWTSRHGFMDYWEAETFFGNYACGIDLQPQPYGSSLPDPTIWVDYPTLEAAKAAAQADYERRILEALQ